MSSLPAALLAGSGGFAHDPRFTLGAEIPAITAPTDPLGDAWREGHAAGLAEAEAAAEARAAAEDAARGALALTLARLDAAQTEQLRQRLLATVEALCETALAPLALDRAALAARVERAAAMLARADDDKVLRLHPDDFKLIGRQLPAGLEVVPDPALERGSLRLETTAGGVEDGPAQWRRTLAETLDPC